MNVNGVKGIGTEEYVYPGGNRKTENGEAWRRGRQTKFGEIMKMKTAGAAAALKSERTTAASELEQSAAYREYLEYLLSGAETVKVFGVDYIGTISRLYSTGKPDAANFADAFPQYDVVTHVGNTNVSSANWQRNDFPFWQYFDKNASADCLNDWKPTGPNPPQTDSYIQRNVSAIGSGKMAVLIPESLQEKMDADEDYARAIMEKMQKWKEDYDRRDNALAASYGYNVMEHQASKSYCLQLDENGEVVNATVTSGGRITQSSDEMVQAYYKCKKKQAEYARLMEANAVKRKLQETAVRKSDEQEEIRLAELASVLADRKIVKRE